MSQATYSKSQTKDSPPGIAGISVRGCKFLYNECSVEIPALTRIAGANSSGKSSIMQPLLSLKQTLEASYDPGPLLLSGPNVRLTSAGQLFSQLSEKNSSDSFSAKIEISNCPSIITLFKKSTETGIEIGEMAYRNEQKRMTISFKMAREDIVRAAEKLAVPYQPLKDVLLKLQEIEFICLLWLKSVVSWCGKSARGFWGIVLGAGKEKLAQQLCFRMIASPSELVENHIRKLIPVPGLRGNPERSYKSTAVGSDFQGTFENYVASAVSPWQKTEDKRLQDLIRFLETLGLACKVGARQGNDTQVQQQVGRLPRSGRGIDRVSVVDVGLRVSQVWPVLVSLLGAKPGQLVYIEQPEIHLHPRAQAALAEVLAEAASRGVRVVVGTHSELLLQAVQSLVAEGKILPEEVKLHWLTGREGGVAGASSADLDEAGAFADWPEDLGDVSLKLESRYLDAVGDCLLKV